LKLLFENWNRFLNEEQENPVTPVATRMFAIDGKLPGEGDAGQNWNHNLAEDIVKEALKWKEIKEKITT
jgi:hypothetical protein